MRNEGGSPVTTWTAMCYASFASGALPGGQYDVPPVHIPLFTAQNGQTATLSLQDCHEPIPGVRAQQIVAKVTKPGATASVTVEVVVDTTDPFTCSGTPIAVNSSGSWTPRSTTYDTDGDTCTDYDELGGSTDPFNPFDCGELDNDGNLAGVSDLLLGDLNSGVGLFYCIVKTDHQASDNRVQTFQQCNVDIENGGITPDPDVPPTWEDTCVSLEAANPGDCPEGSLQNPAEPGPDGLPGPPPPPRYTMAAPSEGAGFFYPGGAGSPGGVCGSTDCSVVTTCFEDTGPVAGTGPNIIWTATILNPEGGTTVQADTDGDTVKDTQVDRVSSGSVDIWYNQSNASCNALAPKGDPGFDNLALQSIHAYGKGGSDVNANPAPWRPGPNPGASVTDFDGDGCTDEQELDRYDSTPTCGDDPQNPSDSFAPGADLSGIYDLSVRVTRGDCVDDQCTAEVPGVYFFCRADLQHDTGDNSVAVRPYCYWDAVVVDINPEAYPGIRGDGMAGAPPPGPDDQGDGNFAFGDVDTAHAVLNGILNKTTGNFEISGCIESLDGVGILGNVYLELTVSGHQLPGTADIWAFQDETDCTTGAQFGGYQALHGAPALDDAELRLVRANPNKGKTYDSDGDGVPDAAELQDDDACGRRDPFNPYDYYDVSIPRDGVIDLSNDILGVIIHFQPGGYLPGDENWDRPPAMIGRGAGSNWNRGSPDGVIDLANDILGANLQFNPGGC